MPLTNKSTHTQGKISVYLVLLIFVFIPFFAMFHFCTTGAIMSQDDAVVSALLHLGSLKSLVSQFALIRPDFCRRTVAITTLNL